MRRRYRSATQMALARGEPLPPGMRNDYWGLAGLSAWTPEGIARTAAAREEETRGRRMLPKPRIHDAQRHDCEMDNADLFEVSNPRQAIADFLLTT
jgi:hypothetical protein